jgi:phospholipid/cholesterol/gamma-HCH transport system substrate-binding protein
LTIARGVAIAALALAIVLVALLLVRGANTHEYDLLFQNAGQLVKGDDVQVGGRRIGSVREITLTDDNRARVRIRVEEPFAPLRDGTRAVIRLTSLSGIANRFIALTPAPNSAKELDDGATLAAGSTTGVVDLDQLFNTLDPKARRDLQGVIKGFATQYDGRGKEAGETAEYFNPFLSTSRQLVNQLTQDEGTLTDFIVNSSRAVTAIAEKRDDVASLVGNTNTTAAAIASQDAALEQALGLLPTTLRRANTTFVNLRATLDDLDPLVDASKPATKELAPFLRRLRPLVHDARPTIEDLRTLIRKPGKNNDLIELTAKQPRLAELTATVFPRTIRTLNRAQPVIEYARMYAPDLAGYLTKFGQGASNYDANGHFARIQPMFGGYSFADNPAGGVLLPVDPASRLAGFDSGNLKRCPGGATQPSPDGSSNWPVQDCDPSTALSGP